MTDLKSEIQNNYLKKGVIPDVVTVIKQEIETDSENESKILLNYFCNLSKEKQDVVENVLMYVCGWTLKSLIRIADQRKLRVDEH